MSLAAAKAKAIEYADRDPVAEKLQAKLDDKANRIAAEKQREADELEKISLRIMTDLWNEYSSLPRYKQKATSSQKEERRKWKTNIKPVLGNIPVKDITPVMVNTLIKNLAKKSPVSANRLFSFMQVLFKPALADGWITVHPMQHLDKPVKEKPRKRFLSDEEIKAVWPHFDNLTDNPCDILRFVLLTCQRPGEVAAMQWKDIDLENRLWTQADNKTDTPNLVPLSQPVMNILTTKKKKSKWVFPSSYNKAKGAKSGHAKSTKNAREKVHEWSGVVGWTAHDLRRTARTIMSRLKIKHHILERVLNHSQGGISGVYDRYDYLDEKRIALDKLGKEIMRITTGKIESGKIVGQ